MIVPTIVLLVGFLLLSFLLTGQEPVAEREMQKERRPFEVVRENGGRDVWRPAGTADQRSEPEHSVLSDAVVHTVDSRGNPIAGVTITRIDEFRADRDQSEHVLLGKSDRSGFLDVKLPVGRLSGLVAQAGGFATTRIDVAPDSTPLDLITIELQAGASIMGHVASALGQRVGGVVVAAFEDSVRPRVQDAIGFSKGQPGSLSGVSTVDGVFVIEGVDPEKSYTLVGASPDYVSVRDLAGVTSRSSGVELIVGRLLGAVVQFRERGGEALQIDGRLGGAIGSRVPDVSGFLPLVAGGFQHRLAGLTQTDGDHSVTWLYPVADISLDVVGPLRSSLNVPGYEAATYEFELSPVSSGIREFSVELEPKGSGFGLLSVVFHRASEELISAVDALEGVVGQVVLVPTDGRSEWAMLSLESLQDTECQVPAGVYEAYFRDPDGLFVSEPESVVVQPGSQSTLVVDLAIAGAIDLELQTDFGDAIIGESRVYFSSAEEPEKRKMKYFAQAPYLLAPVEAGEIVLTLNEGMETWGVKKVVRVNPGAVAAVHLTVD